MGQEANQYAEQYLIELRECRDEDKIFNYLKEDKPGVALELAKLVHTPPRILELLSNHVSITVRHEVAKNKSTPTEVLKQMSMAKDMLVRDYARRTLISLN